MDFFNKITNFDFMGKRRLAASFSAFLMIGSLILIIPGVRGLNFGIDFTGGVLLELAYPGPAALPDIRERLAASGLAMHRCRTSVRPAM